MLTGAQNQQQDSPFVINVGGSGGSEASTGGGGMTIEDYLRLMGLGS